MTKQKQFVLIEDFDDLAKVFAWDLIVDAANSEEFNRQRAWCEQQFGGPAEPDLCGCDGRWTVFWRGSAACDSWAVNSYHWYFKQPQDYLLFVLKWT